MEFAGGSRREGNIPVCDRLFKLFEELIGDGFVFLADWLYKSPSWGILRVNSQGSNKKVVIAAFFDFRISGHPTALKNVFRIPVPIAKKNVLSFAMAGYKALCVMAGHFFRHLFDKSIGW